MLLLARGANCTTTSRMQFCFMYCNINPSYRRAISTRLEMQWVRWHCTVRPYIRYDTMPHIKDMTILCSTTCMIQYIVCMVCMTSLHCKVTKFNYNSMLIQVSGIAPIALCTWPCTVTLHALKLMNPFSCLYINPLVTLLKNPSLCKSLQE